MKGELRHIALARPRIKGGRGRRVLGLQQILSICFNITMTQSSLPIEIPEVELTPLVNWLLNLVAEQQQIIEEQQQTIAQLEGKVNRLEEELKAAKKLKGKPKIRPSTLNQEENLPKEGGKRAGSDKRSKKLSFVVDEERKIEPEELPEGATK